MSRSTVIDDVATFNRFHALCESLRGPDFASRRDKPLVYWALPTDRRLPQAFLPRTVGELIETRYDALATTSGVGKKKMTALVELLQRVINHEPEVALESVPTPLGSAEDLALVPREFSPDSVSELVWAQWRELVRCSGMSHEPLGRLCESLQQLPTVIWRTPLSFYLDKSLGDIRRLKTHGEKRISSVLRVFHAVSSVMACNHTASGLAVRLAPAAIVRVEHWLACAMAAETMPTHPEIVAQLAQPLLEQLKLDSGATVFALARGRLGIEADGVPVRSQARKLGVTRARVYQLLEECNLVMSIRWPDGRRQLDELAQRLDRNFAPAECGNLVGGLRELLYPLKLDAVAKHLVPDLTR